MKKIIWGLISFMITQLAFAQCFTVQTTGGTPNSPSIAICINELPATLIPDVPGGTFSGPGVGVIGPDIFTITTAGNHTITYSFNNTNCTDVITIEEADLQPIINPIAGLPAINKAIFVCQDQPAFSFTGNLDGTASNDVNFTIGSTILNPPNDNVFDPMDFPIGPHTIFYTYIDPNSGCTSFDTLEVNVIVTPDASFSGLPDTMCLSDDPVVLTPINSGDFSSDCGGISVVNPNVFDPSLLTTAGICTITFEHISLGSGCTAISTQEVVILDDLVIDFEVTGDECFMNIDSITYTGTPVGAGAVFNWEIEDGTIINNMGSTILVEWNSAGDKIISLSLDNVPCAGMPLAKMVTKTGLTINTIQDIVLEPGNSIDLATTVDAPNGSTITYEWTPPTNLICNNDCSAPTVTPTETTTYIVTAMADNACIASDSVTITIVTNKKIFVANVFTPNDDGKNDELMVRVKGAVTMTFSVFSRWGELVFQSNDIGQGWDGMNNGKRMNTGVYVYVVEATFTDGQSLRKTGNTTLLR